MREWVDPQTGEIFALVPLAWWQNAVDAAREAASSRWYGGECACEFCRVVAAVLAAAE